LSVIGVFRGTTANRDFQRPQSSSASIGPKSQVAVWPRLAHSERVKPGPRENAATTMPVPSHRFWRRSGSLAIFAPIRRASSRVSSLAAERLAPARNCAARRPNPTTPMFTAPPSQRSPQGAGGGVNRKAIYYHDWNAERRLNEEVRHLRSLS
jgi:hypothetical protein